jgi:hypothetical protein
MQIGTLSLAKLRALAAEAGLEGQRSAPTTAPEEVALAASEPAPVTKEAEEAADELDDLLGDDEEDEAPVQNQV